MNNKALVEISVPAAGQKYDVYIPLESKMSEVVKMVAGALDVYKRQAQRYGIRIEEIGISRCEDFVFGLSKISLEPFLSKQSFCLIRATVCLIWIIPKRKSISFHVNAHTSPVRKPA